MSEPRLAAASIDIYEGRGAARPARAPRASPARTGATVIADSLRVLLVEAEAGAAAETSKVLKAKIGPASEIDWVRDLAGASAEFGRDRHDLHVVVLDPNWEQAIAQLIGADADRRAATLVLTSVPDPELEARMIESGAAEFALRDDLVEGDAGILVRRALIRRKALLRAGQEAQKLHAELTRLRLLRKADRRLIENASHDFRTPLAVIKEFGSIMAEGLAGDINDEQAEFLGIILSRVDQLTGMIDGILDASRLESDLVAVRRRKQSVREVIEQVLPTLEQRARSYSVELSVRIDDALPLVFCDSDSIGRVISNLVVNACKSMTEGGHILLWARCEPGGSKVTVGVTDDGRGIAQEHIDLIFDRFRQVATDTLPSTDGFGLGLHICSELVRVNFGELRAQSEPKKGSTFAFTLPVFDLDALTPLHFEFLRASRHRFQKVSLALASAPMAGRLATEMENLLCRQLRSYDLMLPVREDAWLLCLAADEGELDGIAGRIRDAHAAANRNRPEGPLPVLTIDPAGTWDIGGHEAVLLDAVRSAVRQDGAGGGLH